MAKLTLYFPHLLRFEGGFIDDPSDPGGATNKGITLATLRRYAGVLGVPGTLDDLRGLSDAQALEIYQIGYWDALRADEIADQALAEIVVDFYINAGTPAVRVLQGLLNDLTLTALTVDGVFGPETLRVWQSADPTELYRRFKRARVQYYRDLVQRKPALAKFLNGWLNRVNSFPER